MKKYILLCTVILTMLIITPLLSVKYTREDVSRKTVENDSKTVSVMMTSGGTIEQVDEREYIIGCVAGEINPEYHEEALKAQAVAAYTYLKYIKNNNLSADNGDITDNPAEHQVYIDKEARKKLWKDNFDEYEEKIEKAVDAVSGEIITYNNQPIMAVYFDLCNGMTEDAEVVWGRKIEYLVPVISDGDKLSSNLENDTEFTVDDFKKCLSDYNIDFSDDKFDFNTDKSDSGTVKEIEINGKKIKGTEFRTKLKLRSCDFSIKCDNGKIKIKCMGNGHFVGMSQYGADYMARQGSDYKEILTHYYKNTKIT